jgi:hypothetical protein
MAAKPDFNLNLDIQVLGRHFPVQHIPFKNGEVKNLASDQGSYVEVEAADTIHGGQKGVLMKFNVFRMKDGKREIIARPEVFSVMGKEAELSITEKQGGAETMRLKVMANKAF